MKTRKEVMVRATTTRAMIVEAEKKGYSLYKGKSYICPNCARRVDLKRHPTDSNFFKSAARKVKLFYHATKPTVAACPCGYRRIDTPTMKYDVYCRARNSNGKPCARKITHSDLCTFHYNREKAGKNITRR